MRAQIKEKREVAKGTLLVTFDLLGEGVDFTPGQYSPRHAPRCRSPGRQGPAEAHHRRHVSERERRSRLRDEDARQKRSLDELPVGADVEVEPPKGSFALPEDTSRPIVFVAGGIGITVFRSMLRYIQDEGLSYRVTLIYSNRDRESTAFLDGFTSSRTRNPTFGSSSR